MSFPRYPKYKASGVEWLGEVPEHWSVVKTVRFFKIAMGQTILKEDLVDDGQWPVFSATDGDQYFGRVNDPQVRLSIGDIVIPARGNSIGAVKIVKEPSTTTQTTIYCKNLSGGQLQPEYVFHFLRGCRENLFYFTQTAIPQITVNEVGSNPVLVPPTGEQRLIAQFLDRETAKIDGLVAEQRRLIELLKEKRQAVISHAVTKGLNPNAPLKPSGIAWLGDVPEHWSVVALKRIADIQTGIAKGKDYGTEETVAVPYLRVANVQDGYLDLETITTIQIPASDVERYRLRSGDVLMNEGGDYDKLGRGCVWHGRIDPCIHQNHVFAVRPHGASPEWISAIIGSQYAQFYFMILSKQSTNLASISSTNLMELPVIVPPSVDQKAILDFISKTSSSFDTLTAEANRAIELLQERRTALISAAVTGKIDVRGVAEGSAV